MAGFIADPNATWRDDQLGVRFYRHWRRASELYGFVAAELKGAATADEVAHALRPVVPHRLVATREVSYATARPVLIEVAVVRPRHLPAVRARLAGLVARGVAAQLAKMK